MPKQGQSVESCILTEFKKKKGDAVQVGDVLFSYETDKASFEETAQAAGTVLDIFFSEGDEIPVLTNVMVIGSPGESAAEFRPGGNLQNSPQEDLPETKPETGLPGATPQITAGEQNVSSKRTSAESFASPRARALAEKHAIEAKQIQGTGPGGRVIERDIINVTENSPKSTPLAKIILKETKSPAPQAGSGLAGMIKASDAGAKNPVYSSDSKIKPLSNMRKLIAKAMHASLQNSAQLTHHLGADARNIMTLRKQIKKAVKEGYPTDISINDLVCFAVIRALKKFPQVNAHFLGDSVRLFEKVHLGLAVDTERGLMVPCVKNADDLTVQGLANQLKEVASLCKTGGISPDLLSPEAASFTVSNLGNYGVEIFTPIINLPQAAILGVNTIVPRPKDLGEGVYGFVPFMGLSLTYDHRALDGGEATRFLKQIAAEMEGLEIRL
jgi:pyruvate dehydrogenase E2 component (dihydrolipoamide acetyltransferase)